MYFHIDIYRGFKLNHSSKWGNEALIIQEGFLEYTVVYDHTLEPCLLEHLI